MHPRAWLHCLPACALKASPQLASASIPSSRDWRVSVLLPSGAKSLWSAVKDDAYVRMATVLWVPKSNPCKGPPTYSLFFPFETHIRDMGSIPRWRRSPVEGVATHCSILAWRIPWTKEPGEPQVYRVTKRQTRLK